MESASVEPSIAGQPRTPPSGCNVALTNAEPIELARVLGGVCTSCARLWRREPMPMHGRRRSRGACSRMDSSPAPKKEPMSTRSCGECVLRSGRAMSQHGQTQTRGTCSTRRLWRATTRERNVTSRSGSHPPGRAGACSAHPRCAGAVLSAATRVCQPGRRRGRPCGGDGRLSTCGRQRPRRR